MPSRLPPLPSPPHHGTDDSVDSDDDRGTSSSGSSGESWRYRGWSTGCTVRSRGSRKDCHSSNTESNMNNDNNSTTATNDDGSYSAGCFGCSPAEPSAAPPEEVGFLRPMHLKSSDNYCHDHQDFDFTNGNCSESGEDVKSSARPAFASPWPPELIRIVLTHLAHHPQSLYCASLVSRSWHALATSVLWHSISFESATNEVHIITFHKFCLALQTAAISRVLSRGGLGSHSSPPHSPKLPNPLCFTRHLTLPEGPTRVVWDALYPLLVTDHSAIISCSNRISARTTMPACPEPMRAVTDMPQTSPSSHSTQLLSLSVPDLDHVPSDFVLRLVGASRRLRAIHIGGSTARVGNEGLTDRMLEAIGVQCDALSWIRIQVREPHSLNHGRLSPRQSVVTPLGVAKLVCRFSATLVGIEIAGVTGDWSAASDLLSGASWDRLESLTFLSCAVDTSMLKAFVPTHRERRSLETVCINNIPTLSSTNPPTPTPDQQDPALWASDPTPFAPRTISSSCPLPQSAIGPTSLLIPQKSAKAAAAAASVATVFSLCPRLALLHLATTEDARIAASLIATFTPLQSVRRLTLRGVASDTAEGPATEEEGRDLLAEDHSVEGDDEENEYESSSPARSRSLMPALVEVHDPEDSSVGAADDMLVDPQTDETASIGTSSAPELCPIFPGSPSWSSTTWSVRSQLSVGSLSASPWCLPLSPRLAPPPSSSSSSSLSELSLHGEPCFHNINGQPGGGTGTCDHALIRARRSGTTVQGYLRRRRRRLWRDRHRGHGYSRGMARLPRGFL